MPILEMLRFNLARRVFFEGPRFRFLELKKCLLFIMTTLLIGIFFVYNGKHISTTQEKESTLDMKFYEAIYTNFSVEDFNNNYVKSEEYKNYNRVWDSADISVESSEEIFITTNVVITSNQTQSRCPESPLLRGVICDPKNNHCLKGRKMANGIETGHCVPGDFPYNDGKGNWIYGHDCEIWGWCPARRLWPPLKGFAAVLADTKNSTLWVINTIRFNDYDIDFDNLFRVKESQIICRYNPKTAPNCPIFILGDILKYSRNNNLSYEEVAKFGATITLQIEWQCRLPFFSKFDYLKDCRLDYSFLKTVNGSYTYRHEFFFENGKVREHWMAYGLRIKVNVITKLERYDIFLFVSIFMAYTTVFSVVFWGFETYVRSRIERRGVNIDETIVVDQDATFIELVVRDNQLDIDEYTPLTHLCEAEINDQETSKEIEEVQLFC